MASSNDLTIVTWLWHGWRPVYKAEHVNRLKARLDATMSVPFRFVCVTDDERGLACDTFPLWTMPRAKIPGRLDVGQKIIPDCFVRLRMFDPGVGRLFGPRIVSMDVDCVVLKDLASLFNNDYDFIAARGYRSHLCGSMWQLRTGTNENVWRSYDPVESPKLIAGSTHNGYPLSGSDQAWMSLCMPDAPLWGEDEGVCQFMEMRPQRIIPKNARVVFFAGAVKPWLRDCQMISKPLYDAYRA